MAVIFDQSLGVIFGAIFDGGDEYACQSYLIARASTHASHVVVIILVINCLIRIYLILSTTGLSHEYPIPRDIPLKTHTIPRMGWVLKVESHIDPWDGRRDNIPSHPISFRSVSWWDGAKSRRGCHFWSCENLGCSWFNGSCTVKIRKDLIFRSSI